MFKIRIGSFKRFGDYLSASNSSNVGFTFNINDVKGTKQISFINSSLTPSSSATTLILLLPPLPSSPLSPNLSQNLLFKTLNRQTVTKHTKIALLSTIGGGAFMCRYLGMAESIARSAGIIALELGNEGEYYRTCINVAYDQIHQGNFKGSGALIRQIHKWAHEKKDQNLVGICKSAWLFRRGVRRVWKEKGRELMRIDGAAEKVEDELYRIRCG